MGQGEPAFAARWGPDHPLCSPMAPTRYALIMASSSCSGPIGSRGLGIPAYPVPGSPQRVADARPIGGLAIKVDLRADPSGD
jgi:hypothetical protein